MARTKNTRGGKKKPPTTSAPQTNLSSSEIEQIDQLIQQAEQLIVASEFEQAKDICNQALALQNDHVKALETLALCELELGQVKSARKNFLKCLNHSKPNVEPAVHLYLAQLSGSAKEALSHYNSALDLLKSKLNQILQAKSTQSTQKEEEEKQEQEQENGQLNNQNQLTTSNVPTELENRVVSCSNNKVNYWSVDEAQIRRSCSRALVAMTEIYLTDLCFEATAEEKCLEYLAMASLIDPTDPEPLQTLASVRLSQSEQELAKEALLLSWSLWRDKVTSVGKTPTETEKKGDLNEKNDGNKEPLLMDEKMDSNLVVEEKMMIDEEEEQEVTIEEEEEETNDLPAIETRMSWAKLAIECEMWNYSIQVLQQCEAEDDENAEIQYLLVIAWFLLGQSRPPVQGQIYPNIVNDNLNDNVDVDRKLVPDSVAVGHGLGQIECWLEAQESIETCFQLWERLGESSGLDKDIINHLKEIIKELNQVGINVKTDKNQTNQDEPEAEEDQEEEENVINDQDWLDDVSDIDMT